MMRADEGFQSDQAGWRVGEFPPMACDDYADSSVCRVKLDPNALIKKRYVGILTVKHIQSRWRAEKWRSVTLDCQSNFHRRTPLLSV
jgi:uncharacterized protein YcnI